MPIQRASLDEQIAEINRELQLRKQLYPIWISHGKLKRADANKQWSRLRAVKRSLLRLQEIEQGKQATLPLNE